MNILITDKVEDEIISTFKKTGYNVTYNEMDPQTLLNEISKYDALMVRSRTKVTSEVIKAGAKGKLKVIGRAGVGVDNIDVKTATENGIKVVNAPTGSTVSVAELTVGMMISASRSIPQADSSMKQGKWEKKAFKGVELSGKTLGVIGIGRIGVEVAKRALAFEMRVLAFDKYITRSPLPRKIQMVTMDKLLKESDYITLHIPFVKEEGAIIKEEEFEKMKNNVIIINCARGGVINERALLKYLNSGKVYAAALDVYEVEPPVFKDLINHPRVICTPHIGASTKEAQLKAGMICTDQIIKALKNEKLEYWVNKELKP
ncbi:MAG: hydroxyacid dehydrogenase [Candidatus Thermoplasmatota archaeon]